MAKKCGATLGYLIPPTYFHRVVAIDNFRLWICFAFLFLTWFAVAIWAIAAHYVYYSEVAPITRLRIIEDLSGGLTSLPSFCSGYLGRYDYAPDNTTNRWAFGGDLLGSKCASSCFSSNGPSSGCFFDPELVQKGTDDIFFATAFNEETTILYHGDYDWYSKYWMRYMLSLNSTFNASLNSYPSTNNADLDQFARQYWSQLAFNDVPGNASTFSKSFSQFNYSSSPCPYALSLSDSLESWGQCKRKGSYLVPQTTGYAAQLLLDFQIDLPRSESYDWFGMDQVKKLDFPTVLKDQSGNVIQTFAPGEAIKITMNSALQAAGIDLDAAIPQQAKFPISTGSPRARTVGVELEMHVEISNTLEASGSDRLPACEIRVQGRPSWQTRQAIQTLDVYGSSRTRVYSGVHFKFYVKGAFRWFIFSSFLYVLSIGTSWLVLPLFIIFIFAMNFLGTVSEVLRGYCYEHVDVKGEVDGTSARVLASNFSLEELSDLVEDHGAVLGISKDQAQRRLNQILLNNKAIDATSRELLMQFFFVNTADEWPSTGESALLPDKFLHAVTSNDNLRDFKDVMKLLDPVGDNKGVLEKFFTDATVEALAQPTIQSGKAVMAPHDTVEQLSNRLKLKSSLWVVQRCNLMRVRLGQVAIRATVEKLSGVSDQLKEIAIKLQGKF